MSQRKGISLCDPQIGEGEKQALCRVIDSCWLTMGERVAEFETRFAEMHGRETAVAVNSCTAALHLALAAIGVGPGDEVLVPAMTFIATVNAVLYTGATPVLVDIESETRPHISLEHAQSLITPRTKAVVIMHYGGYLMDLDKWSDFCRQRGLVLVEDSAHALVTGRVGQVADVSAFSFFSNKNMTTAEGGMVMAKDPEVLNRAKCMRSHGMTHSTLERDRGRVFSYDVVELGQNYRMDELRASIGLVQLESIREWNERRLELTGLYREIVAEKMPEVVVPFENGHETSAHILPVILPESSDRAAIMAALRKEGIQSSIHYPPANKLSYHRERWFAGVSLPNTEEFAGRELTLPLHPGLSDSDVVAVLAELKKNL